MKLICPLCGNELLKKDKSYCCENHHSFDIARQGYVNLLAVQQKHSLLPGDTREQVLSRRAFLEGGFYAPIAQTLLETARSLGLSGSMLDVGCGEGYYGSRAAGALPGAHVTGVDISKDAVRMAAGRYKEGTWLCATASKLPFPKEFDLVLSMFALTLPEEFSRVLKEKGIFIQVLAAEDHLMGLR